MQPFFYLTNLMKKVLVGALLLSSLSSFGKSKYDDKPDPAIKNGAITPYIAYAYPFFSDIKHTGIFIAGAEYQVSRGLNAGLQYGYYQWRTPMMLARNQFSGTNYQIGDVMRGHIFMLTIDYCYLNRGRVSLAAGFGLGTISANKSLHIIDSTGLSTETKYPYRLNSFTGRIRLIDAKVRITKNLGIYGGLGLGSDGVFAIGAHYTFNTIKD